METEAEQRREEAVACHGDSLPQEVLSGKCVLATLGQCDTISHAIANRVMGDHVLWLKTRETC